MFLIKNLQAKYVIDRSLQTMDAIFIKEKKTYSKVNTYTLNFNTYHVKQTF